RQVSVSTSKDRYSPPGPLLATSASPNPTSPPPPTLRPDIAPLQWCCRKPPKVCCPNPALAPATHEPVSSSPNSARLEPNRCSRNSSPHMKPNTSAHCWNKSSTNTAPPLSAWAEPDCETAPHGRCAAA